MKKGSAKCFLFLRRHNEFISKVYTQTKRVKTTNFVLSAVWHHEARFSTAAFSAFDVVGFSVIINSSFACFSIIEREMVCQY